MLMYGGLICLAAQQHILSGTYGTTPTVNSGCAENPSVADKEIQMIEVVGVFRTHRVKKRFDCVYDAAEFRENLDAHYPLKILWREI